MKTIVMLKDQNQNLVKILDEYQAQESTPEQWFENNTSGWNQVVNRQYPDNFYLGYRWEVCFPELY